MKKLSLALLILLGLCWQAAAANCNASNGSCFWIGGTGTMDFSTDGSHWSNTTGGTACSCEPTSTSQLVFDANSGGGTVTMGAGPFTWGGTVTNALQLGGFTGTLDGSTNNPNVTVTTTGVVLSDTSGSHTWNLGNGTWTFNSSATTTFWSISNASLTLTAGSSTIVLNSTAASAAPVVALDGKTFHNFTFTSSASAACFSVTGANTFSTLTLTGPVCVEIVTATTQTVSTALSLSGTSGNYAALFSSAIGSAATIAAPASSTGTWTTLRDITFTTNAPAFTNCLSLGHNTLNGGSCTAPSGGGGGGFVGLIGGGI